MVHAPAPLTEGRRVRLLAVVHRSDIGGTEVCFGRVMRALTEDSRFELCAAYPSGGALDAAWQDFGGHLEYDAGVLPDTYDWNAYRGWLRRTFGRARGDFRAQVAAWQPDVIVSFTSVLTAPMDVAAQLGVPGIAYVREFVQPPAVRSWLWRRLARRATRLIGVSSEVAQQLEAFAPGRVRLVHDGVPLPETAHEAVWPPASPLIAFYGGYDPRKGGEVFVRMARLVLDAVPGAHFAYHGTPGHGQEGHAAHVRDLVRSLGVADAIDFDETGDFAPTFGRNSLVVMPSVREGLGLVALDAMSFGVPVVASRTGGLLDVVDDGVTGALVTPGDVAAFAEAALGIVSDSAGLTAMGDAARRRVEERFTVERAVEGLLAVVDDVLDGEAGRG